MCTLLQYKYINCLLKFKCIEFVYFNTLVQIQYLNELGQLFNSEQVYWYDDFFLMLDYDKIGTDHSIQN